MKFRKSTVVYRLYIYISCFLGRDPGTLKSDIASKKPSTINLFGFETLKLKIRRLKLWKPTLEPCLLHQCFHVAGIVMPGPANIYIYIYIRIRICMYIYIYTYICFIYTVYMYIHLSLSLSLCIYIYIYIYIMPPWLCEDALMALLT